MRLRSILWRARTCAVRPGRLIWPCAMKAWTPGRAMTSGHSVDRLRLGADGVPDLRSLSCGAGGDPPPGLTRPVSSQKRDWKEVSPPTWPRRCRWRLRATLASTPEAGAARECLTGQVLVQTAFRLGSVGGGIAGRQASIPIPNCWGVASSGGRMRAPKAADCCGERRPCAVRRQCCAWIRGIGHGQRDRICRARAIGLRSRNRRSGTLRVSAAWPISTGRAT